MYVSFNVKINISWGISLDHLKKVGYNVLVPIYLHFIGNNLKHDRVWEILY